MFWDIFWAYIVVMVLCWCAVAFGLGANQRDRWDRATRLTKNKRPDLDWYGNSVPSESSVRARYLDITTGGATIGILLSLIWPIGVPIYLAYRKGQFISQKLAARDKEKEAS